MPFRWSIRAAAVLTSLILVTGCTTDDGGDLPALNDAGAPASDGSATTAPPSDPASAAVDSDERVLADYRAYWADVVAVRAAGNPTAARVEAHTSGFRLNQLRTEIARDREQGRVPKGKPVLLDPDVQERQDGKAIVVDCLDSNDWLFYSRETGELVDKPSGRTYPVTAHLQLDPDVNVWKVESMIIEQEGKCDG